MAAIRSRDTRPELSLRQGLREAGLTGYRCNARGLPGKPDIAYTKWKLAVFVDGAFWHGHPDHFQFGKLSEYWDSKISRTQERDRIQEQELRKSGFEVIRLWDFEVNDSVSDCVNRIRRTLARLGRPESK
jgi:DNA mismatch endonuclease, patch repair protein